MSSIRVGIRRWGRTPGAHRLRGAVAGVLTWVVPVLVIGLVDFGPGHTLTASKLVSGLLALGLLIAAVRRPDRALLALIILLPFQGLIIARLWAWGLPASAASHLGAWKETLALGVIIAGVHAFIATGRRADAVDRIALGFVALAAVYEVLQPHILPSAPTTSSIRLLGFRETAGFVLVMLGARHAPLGEGFARRAARVVFAVGGAVSAIGIYEAIFSSAWNHFIVHTIKYPAYDAAVLHGHLLHPNDIRVYGIVGGVKVVRIGSVFLDELNFGFYLLLPFAVGIERVVRRTASPLAIMTTILIGAALLLTQTRSAIIGALVVAFLALSWTAGRPLRWRAQVAIFLAGLALVAIPAAVSTGVVKRFGQVNDASNQSTAGHEAGFWSGLRTIEAHPLGQGLGTGAGIGQRFDVADDRVPENSYLNVGDQMGVLAMLLFVALTIGLILRLRATARVRADPLVTAAFAASAGLAVAAWFLQTWLDFGVAWTFWGIAGAMLGTVRQAAPAAAPVRPESPELQAGRQPALV